MDSDVRTLSIKAEPLVEDFKIENDPLQIINFTVNEDTKPERNVFLQLENQESINNDVLDNWNCRTVFSQSDYKQVEQKGSPTSFSTWNEADLKSETINDFGKVGGLVYEDWKIKNEALDIIGEDVKREGPSVVESPVQYATQTNMDRTIDIVIKKEPGIENFENENVPLDDSYSNMCRSKPEPELIDQLEILNVERNGEFVVEQSYKARSADFDRDSTEVRKFRCDQCEFETIYSYNFKTHLLRHVKSEDVKKFKCNDCDYRTLQKSNLKTHMMRHINSEDVKKFKCNDCDYRTLQKGHLKKHMMRHINSEDVKKFKCNYCDHRTLDKSNLRAHMRRHMNSSEVRKFKCDQCNFETIYNHRFKTHFRRHVKSEDVKKFKCDG